MFAGILIALNWSRSRLKTVVDDLGEKVDQLGKRVEELGQKLEQRIEAVEESVQQPPAGTPPDVAANWEEIRELWRDARKRMELVIDGISDGRVRRKYSNLPRYSYAKIISELREDGLIGADVARALDIMNERFLSLWRARAATPQEASEFGELNRRADNALPSSPTNRTHATYPRSNRVKLSGSLRPA